MRPRGNIPVFFDILILESSVLFRVPFLSRQTLRDHITGVCNTLFPKNTVFFRDYYLYQTAKIYIQVYTPVIFDRQILKSISLFCVHFFLHRYISAVYVTSVRNILLRKNTVFFRNNALYEVMQNVHQGVYNDIFRHFDLAILYFILCALVAHVYIMKILYVYS